MEEKVTDEDEQAFTMQKILDMLVAAGYFRARISELDLFDKVVGGMSWAITASGIPVDVDVNFKENANIGEKILISEKIVNALQEMKSPFNLKPHLIQGLKLNCIPLYPVIQWLVKAVYDYRRITGNRIRNYAKFKFDIEFNDNNIDRKVTNNGKQFYDDTTSNYGLNRKFKKAKKSVFKTEESLVDATLLEYGFKFRAANAFDLNDDTNDNESSDNIGNKSGIKGGKGKSKIGDKHSAIMKRLEGSNASSKVTPKKGKNKSGNNVDTNIETAEEEENRLKDIELQMSKSGTTGNKVSGSNVVTFIKTDDVKNADDMFEQNRKEMEEQEIMLLKNDAEWQYNTQKSKLERRLNELNQMKKDKIKLYKNEEKNYNEFESEFNEFTIKNKKIKKG